MNRQYTVLILSTISPQSMRLLDYIHTLPFDLIYITNLTICYIDDKEDMKDLLLSHKRNTVPLLILKDFDGDSIFKEGDDIYLWIREMADKLGYEPVPFKEYDDNEKKITIQPPPPKKDQPPPNIQTIAQDIIKAREKTLPKFDVPNKLIKPPNKP